MIHETPERSADFPGIGFLREDGKAHSAAGEMINHDRHPVGERPALRQREGKPGSPEPQVGGNQGEIDMPDMVDPLSGNHPLGSLGGNILGLQCLFCELGRCCLLPRRLRMRIFLEDATDRGRSQMEPGSAEHLSDLLLPQHRAENLQPLDEVANIVGELVNGLGSLHEGLGSCLVDSPNPGADRIRSDLEGPGGLLRRPASGGPEFEDSHPLGGRIVRPPGWSHLAHPCVLDPKLLLTQGQFLLQAVVLGFQANPLVAAVGRPTATVHQGVLGQSNDVEDSEFAVCAPASREWDLRLLVSAGHLGLQGAACL